MQPDRSYLKAAIPTAVLTLTAIAVHPQPARAQARAEVIEYPDPSGVLRAGPEHVRLRTAGGEGVDLYNVTDLLPRPDGSFVIVNAGSSEIFAFDSSGARIWRAGGGGQGPGEFMDIRGAAMLPGDSICVLDPLNRRVSLFDPDGEFVESFQIEIPFEGAGLPTILVALADGTLLVGHLESEAMAPQPEAVYRRQLLFRYSTAGEVLSAEGLAIPSIERFVQAVPEGFGGGVAYWDLAFGRVMTVRAAPVGGILMGDGTHWTVERRAMDGTPLRTHRLARAVEPVTAADRDAYRSRALESAEGLEREVAERRVDEMPYPETKPAYRRFEVDDEGRLWLETYASSEADDGALWIRLDPGTRTAATVRFPPRYRAMAFQGGLAYGIWRDDFDVEHVHVYATESM